MTAYLPTTSSSSSPALFLSSNMLSSQVLGLSPSGDNILLTLPLPCVLLVDDAFELADLDSLFTENADIKKNLSLDFFWPKFDQICRV